MKPKDKIPNELTEQVIQDAIEGKNLFPIHSLEAFKKEVDIEVLVAKIQDLRNEVNCRIEHGAESGGHLEYIQNKLDEILEGK